MSPFFLLFKDFVLQFVANPFGVISLLEFLAFHLRIDGPFVVSRSTLLYSLSQRNYAFPKIESFMLCTEFHYAELPVQYVVWHLPGVLPGNLCFIKCGLRRRRSGAPARACSSYGIMLPSRKTIHSSVSTLFCHGSVRKWKQATKFQASSSRGSAHQKFLLQATASCHHFLPITNQDFFLLYLELIINFLCHQIFIYA